jgi:hypothetical protein
LGLFRPSVSSDSKTLYVQLTDLFEPPPWETDVYVSHRESPSHPWGELEPLAELSQPDHWQSRPFISADDRTMFFYDSSFNGSVTVQRGNGDLGMLVRSSSNAAWSAPVNLGNAVNTTIDYEDMPTLSSDGQTFYFTRYDYSAPDDPTWYNSADIWQSSVLPFDAVGLSGAGGDYSQDFTTLGSDASQPGSPLPAGWTFTANDVVFNNTTTEEFPTRRRVYAGVYNGGNNGDADRALVTDESVNEAGELDFRTRVEQADLRALRLGFDLEAWQVYRSVGTEKAEASFQVVLEADIGDGFTQVADLGIVTTGQKLARPTTGSLVNGNDTAYRTTYDSGPLDVDVPQNATLRVRWISTDVSQHNVVFGLDNVSLRFAAPGDANIDGVFNSIDLIDVLANGEYEDTIVGNSTWSEGDWSNDNEFDSGDLIEALATGVYQPAATVAPVPEPAAHFLLALGALALTLSRRTAAS